MTIAEGEQGEKRRKDRQRFKDSSGQNGDAHHSQYPAPRNSQIKNRRNARMGRKGIKKICGSLKERKEDYRKKLKEKLKNPEVVKFDIFKDNNMEISQDQFTKTALNIDEDDQSGERRNKNEGDSRTSGARSNALLLNPHKAFQMKRGDGNRYDLEEALEEFQIKSKVNQARSFDHGHLKVCIFMVYNS